jgi:hypothetical protein
MEIGRVEVRLVDVRRHRPSISAKNEHDSRS